MAHYSPDFVHTMRSALDQVVTKNAERDVTLAVKAKIAEPVLKTAAEAGGTITV
jgi:hypothetical protein